MKILNGLQIQQKIQRIALEIAEHNISEDHIILAGINNNGLNFANLLHKALTRMELVQSKIAHITLNPASPLSNNIGLSIDSESLMNKVVIVVDDVANTGRTLFFALRPLYLTLPKKIELCVLVDREHKSFPTHIKYFGLSLATTYNENIDVDLTNTKEMAVYLN